MPIFKIFSTLIKGTSRAANTAIKQGTKTYSKSHMYDPQFKELEYTPFLHSSKHIKELFFQAKKENDAEKLQLLYRYLERFKMTEWNNYNITARAIKKALKEMDIFL